MGWSSPYRCLYALTSAGVARSPRSDSAGLPGSALIQKKIRSETPKRIGTSRSSRRTRYRSICYRRLLSSLDLLSASEEDRSERIRSDRARRVALDLLLEGESRRRVGVRNRRQELHDHDVRLLVELDPLLEVRLPSGLLEDVEDRLVAEAELRAVRLEERADEVVRVAEVARPADEVDVTGGFVVFVLYLVGGARGGVGGDL